jgi:hypothetical protein
LCHAIHSHILPTTITIAPHKMPQKNPYKNARKSKSGRILTAPGHG